MAKLKSKRKEKIQSTEKALPGFLDVISPTIIDFAPKKIINGELFQRAIVVKDYPTEPGPAWLSRSVKLPGVTAAIYVEPTDPYALINDIKVAMGQIAGRIEMGGNQYTIEQNKTKLRTTKELLKKIDNEQESVINMTCVFLVTADEPDLLEQRARKLEATLSGGGMRGRTPMMKQESAYRSIGPWALLEEDIRQIGARNMPITSAAASFPFVYSGLNDGNGVLMGTDESGGIVLIDFWLRHGSRTNSNMFISGKPGMGKSTLVKKILRGEYGRGSKIIIIDPEREYKELCEEIGGDWIDCGGGSKGRINPLQVRIVPLDEEDEEERLYPDEIVQRGPLALHFQTLRAFFKLYIESLDDELMAYLEIALEKAYNKKDIFWDTNPENVPNENWPVINDVFEMCVTLAEEENEPLYKKLSVLLRSSAIGADSYLWGGHTSLSANSNFVVLDIHNLLQADARILRAQFYNVLGWAWNEASRDRTEKVLLGTDETYLLVDPDNPQPLQFLRNTNKRIRKYEGGLLTITHNLVDFFDPAVRRYGQALVDNTTYKFLMGQEGKDIEALQRLMSLSDKEIQILRDGGRGKALFIAGNKRLDMKVQISEDEKVWYGSAGGR